jgi:hypothetical protein
VGENENEILFSNFNPSTRVGDRVLRWCVPTPNSSCDPAVSTIHFNPS